MGRPAVNWVLDYSTVVAGKAIIVVTCKVTCICWMDDHKLLSVNKLNHISAYVSDKHVNKIFYKQRMNI